MVKKNFTRRNAIKRIGSISLAGGLITTGAATGVVAASDGDWDYTYETETFKDSKGFSRTVETNYGEDVQAFNFAVKSHVAEKTDVDDYRIVVELVESGVTSDPNGGAGSGISSVFADVTYENDNAFYFRDDEDWMALWNPDAAGEEVTYADYGKEFVEWGLGEVESYITEKNPAASVLSSAGELIAGLAGLGNPSSESFQADFIYEPKEEVHAYRRFELRLDPQQEVSFEISMDQSPEATPGWSEFGREKTPVFEQEYTISAPPEDPWPTIG